MGLILVDWFHRGLFILFSGARVPFFHRVDRRFHSQTPHCSVHPGFADFTVKPLGNPECKSSPGPPSCRGMVLGRSNEGEWYENEMHVVEDEVVVFPEVWHRCDTNQQEENKSLDVEISSMCNDSSGNHSRSIRKQNLARGKPTDTLFGQSPTDDQSRVVRSIMRHVRKRDQW